jgi:hypothetical protein
MRTKHGFTRQDEDSLIVIPCLIDVDSFTVALDTGASHTVMDLTPLLMSGYEIKNALRKVPLEAASGIIDSYVFRLLLPQIRCGGKKKPSERDKF